MYLKFKCIFEYYINVFKCIFEYYINVFKCIFEYYINVFKCIFEYSKKKATYIRTSTTFLSWIITDSPPPLYRLVST